MVFDAGVGARARLGGWHGKPRANLLQRDGPQLQIKAHNTGICIELELDPEHISCKDLLSHIKEHSLLKD